MKPPDIPRTRSPFPAIGEYGFISDCESVALVAPSGNIEWLCLPRADSPSVFGSLLDRHAGGFRLGPAEVHVPAARRYLPGTMVLETSWGSATGWIVVRDLLLIGQWHHEHELSRTHRRARTDYDADHVLLRTIRCVNGEVQVELDCEPMFDYGRRPATWSFTDRYYHQGLAQASPADLEVRLTTDMRIGFEGGRATARTLLREGDLRFCALSWSEHEPPYSYEEAYRRLVWTPTIGSTGWHVGASPTIPGVPIWSAVPSPSRVLPSRRPAPSSRPQPPRYPRRWAVNETGITVTPGSAIAPSPCGACTRLASIGKQTTSSGLSQTSPNATKRCRSCTAWTESGNWRRLLDHLSGYEWSQPVRTGNAAYAQHQHDVWGALLDSIYIHTRSIDRLDDRLWPILMRQVEEALARWQEPDHGIWEVRGAPRHYTSSKIMCWLAAERGSRLADIAATAG